MKRIYIAGPYSASNIIEALNNMRRGMQLSYEVLKAGFAPFVPFFDYHFSLIGETTLDEYYEYSLAWLRASEAILLLRGWQKSSGTLKELAIAQELNLPIFEQLEALKEWEKRQRLGARL